MKAIETDIAYVQTCTCPCTVFHTYWELLCNTLFEQAVPGLDEDDTFDEVKVWYEGEISMVVTQSPYTFTMKIDAEVDPPKASDVIFYGRKFYIIGAVASGTEANTYVCSNCLKIDLSIVGVYAALLSLNETASAAEGERVEAESGRVSAEEDRVLAENGRASAEAARGTAYTEAEAARDSAYAIAEGARNTAFNAAEASRQAYLESLILPWVVQGILVDDDKTFVSDSYLDTPEAAKVKWDKGYRVYLKIPGGLIEEIIADENGKLTTLSGWNWEYEND